MWEKINLMRSSQRTVGEVVLKSVGEYCARILSTPTSKSYRRFLESSKHDSFPTPKNAVPLRRACSRIGQDQDGERVIPDSRFQEIRNGIEKVRDCYAAGDYEDALEIAKNVLVKSLALFGRNHPSTASAFNNVALIHKATKDFTLATENYRKAIEIYQSLLGSAHPNTLIAYTNLALCLRKMERYEDSKDIYLELLKTYKNKRSELSGSLSSSSVAENPAYVQVSTQLAIVQAHLGALYRLLNEPSMARSLLQEAVSSLVDLHGEHHIMTAQAHNDLALMYLDDADFDKAEEFCGKALAVRKTLLGEKHPDYLRSLDNMVLIFAKRDEYLKTKRK